MIINIATKKVSGIDLTGKMFCLEIIVEGVSGISIKMPSLPNCGGVRAGFQCTS